MPETIADNDYFMAAICLLIMLTAAGSVFWFITFFKELTTL